MFQHDWLLAHQLLLVRQQDADGRSAGLRWRHFDELLGSKHHGVQPPALPEQRVHVRVLPAAAETAFLAHEADSETHGGPLSGRMNSIGWVGITLCNGACTKVGGAEVEQSLLQRFCEASESVLQAEVKIGQQREIIRSLAETAQNSAAEETLLKLLLEAHAMQVAERDRLAAELRHDGP